MRRLALLTGLIAILSMPAAGIGATAVKYRGKVVGDSGKVSFTVSGGKVRKFTIDGVGATCPSGFLLITVYVPSARIKGSTFSAKYKPDPEIDQEIELKGKFSGSRASGTVKAGPLCGYEEKWTAKR